MKERIIRYKGKHIIIYFNVDRCTHVAECLRGAPDVFDSKRQPWVKPDAAHPDKIAEVILQCPTGALHYKRLDGGKEESIPERNSITLQKNGPLDIRGDIEVQTHDHKILYKDTRLSLCRCGGSRHKPLCDGLHTITPFKDDGKTPLKDRVSDNKHERKGKCLIVLQPNGPLKMSGPFTIKDANGQILFHGEKALLCRCGESKNPPFCDGSHTRIDFITEPS